MELSTLERNLLEHPDLSDRSAEDQFALLKERAKHVVGEDRLLRVLTACREERRPMRVKYGIDATGRDIHLGHAVPLFVLRRLQKMGHHVILLIGDFTARVGDPSGRVSTRPMLSREEIQENASRYAAQAGRVIDLRQTEVRFNSEWLEGFSLSDFFRIVGGLTVATALQREDFRNRQTITRAEMLYSTLMAIDSVALKADLELGGDDQLLNFYDAERVMENEQMPPEAAVTTDILLGITGDGTKMSKSRGNFISLVASVEEKYGKLMSIPDALLESYFKLLTDIRDGEWQAVVTGMQEGSLNPRDVKMLLARVVTSDLDGPEAAIVAERDFVSRVVQKDVPEDTPLTIIPMSQAAGWVAILRAIGLQKIVSNAAARRLLDEGGVHDARTGATITLATPVPAQGVEIVLRIGKRTYAKVKISDDAANAEKDEDGR